MIVLWQEPGGDPIDMDSVAILEYEMALLVRLLTSTHPRNPQVLTLDRSAYLILHLMAEVGDPLALQEIASRLHVDLSTVSRQVSAMERKKLIRKHPDPNDFRVHRLTMTPYGVQQFHAMREARYTTYADILRDWPSTERDALANQLTRLNRAIRAYQNPDPHKD